MDDDLGNPPLWAFLLTVLTLLVGAAAAHLSRGWLGRRSPPLPGWVPVLGSGVLGFLVFVLAFWLAAHLVDLVHRL